jgi:hypothetical protein
MLSRIEKTLCLLCIALSTACLLVLAAASCQAQDFRALTPDCCTQASGLTGQNQLLLIRLHRSQSLLDSTRSTAQRIIDQTDKRLTDIAELKAAQVDDLSGKIETLKATQADYDTVKAERDYLKGKTWAGRTLRKTRDVLAYAGGIFIVAFTAKALL